MENLRTSGNRARHGWIAVLLALLQPALGMLYVGKPLRAGVYFVLRYAPVVLVVLLAHNGWMPAGVPALAFAFVIPIVAAVDGYRTAKLHATSFEGPWFTTWKGLVGVFVAMVVAALAFRAFVFEPFRIPSAAMLPTLREGDYIVVGKPLLWRSPLARGDVITFLLPEDRKVTYIKRLVGLPGDEVVYDARSKRVTINGVVAGVEPVGADAQDPTLELVRETIDGRSHLQAFMPRNPSRGGTYRVPEGHYFVLGDNRDNSRDSRFEGVEYVPAGNVTGKALFIWWNTDEPTRAGHVLE
ncbi:MAG TPA: signal peptidase I [Gammaproteobacteria bacterium]|nr:signal peptidase I [Gammaproteobacteria bacterium]